MSVLTLRLSEKDSKAIRKYAEINGISVSELLKKLFWEELERHEDKKIIEGFLEDEKNGTLKTFPYNHKLTEEELG